MEENKLDINSIIGFFLIGAILLYMLWQNQPTAEQLETEAQNEQPTVIDESNSPNQDYQIQAIASDSTTSSDRLNILRDKVGYFAYALSLPSVNSADTSVSTNVLDLKFSNKGGFLSEVKLKEFVNFKEDPIYIIKNDNSDFNITFSTSDNRTLNTKDLFFEPQVSKRGDLTLVSMKLKASETEYLEYLYTFKPDEYMFDFEIKSNGLSTVYDTSKPIELDWELKTLRQAKSISYEGRYTDLHYSYEGDKDDYLGQSDSEEITAQLDWIGYKQHFFSSILIPESTFETAILSSKNLIEDETVDTIYTKHYKSKIPLQLVGGEFDQNMQMYLGPTDYKLLNSYGKNLDEIVPLGWGIFGWINRYLFIPLFAFLIGFMPYGFAIVTMTILIKLVLSFVQYKQFLSQAKMKILKPELDAIRQKYKNNKMKIQQETLAVQNKAGANPMSGCLPGLIQIPVFYALFQFFPSAFDLRQKSFLWADDLSSYDSILDLPFTIPLYGNHVSLFPLLAAIAIFFYMRMTTGQQMANQPTQEGMPDMSKMMKYMIYFSPVMMLFFFNNYASGLSLYYFISNVISIGIMLVIKNFIIDEDKVLRKIEVSKAKPKKQNRFQKKMAEIMEQAEKQKQAQQNKKK